MNVGIDFDGTITSAPHVFKKFIAGLRKANNKVYIVTMRYPSEEMEISQWRNLVDGIIFTSRRAKEPVCLAQGITINVWVDDNPKAIHKDAVAIWGTVSPEGVVHSPTHDREEDLRTYAEALNAHAQK